MVIIMIVSGIIAIIYGTTKQRIARSLGGTIEVVLDPGEKLMMATWKGSDLFYLTEPMDSTYQPKIKWFREKSSVGILESEVKFVERK